MRNAYCCARGPVDLHLHGSACYSDFTYIYRVFEVKWKKKKNNKMKSRGELIELIKKFAHTRIRKRTSCRQHVFEGFTKALGFH